MAEETTSRRGRARRSATSDESTASALVVANKTYKAKVLDIRKIGNYVTFKLNSKQVMYARERSASGMVIDDSIIQPRETEYVTISIPDLHSSELGLGFKIVRLINHGKIDEMTLVALFNAWLTIKIVPFHAGDNFVSRSGETLVHEHDGQTITIVAADLDAESVKEAKSLIASAR